MSGDLITHALTAPVLPTLGPRQWEDLLSQARRSRLLARLAVRAADRGWMPAVPAGPRLHLQGALRVMQRQHDEARWEIDRLRAALARLDGSVVLLKGAAYVAAELPPRRGRLFADIDILVEQPRLHAVESALMAGGWIAEKLDAYDERYYRDWMHELPPLQHVQRHTQLDVHHTITPPTSRFPIDGAALLARARPLSDGSSLKVLAPEDMVLHSAVHLMQEGSFEGGLRDLLDIHDLLGHFAPMDSGFWPALAARAGELGLGLPLSHVLFHIERLFGSTAPADVAPALAALRPRGLSRRLMNTLLTRALRPDHPSCTVPGTRAAALALYVRSHWLRMPWYQILPHLAHKGWKRFQTRRQDAAERARQQAAEAAGGAVPLPER
ncbi:MAG: nucleotidyltransferase family protein [Rubrivivax sp.]|nr:nucleotidyltransferase family protein [Rubrivivax sp.]